VTGVKITANGYFALKMPQSSTKSKNDLFNKINNLFGTLWFCGKVVEARIIAI